MEEISIHDFLKKTTNKEYSLIACLDQIVDPHNIGAVLKNTVDFGFNAVITTKHNSPEENSSIAKIASGALDLIPMITVTNLAQTIDLLKNMTFFVTE